MIGKIFMYLIGTRTDAYYLDASSPLNELTRQMLQLPVLHIAHDTVL